MLLCLLCCGAHGDGHVLKGLLTSLLLLCAVLQLGCQGCGLLVC